MSYDTCLSDIITITENTNGISVTLGKSSADKPAKLQILLLTSGAPNFNPYLSRTTKRKNSGTESQCRCGSVLPPTCEA